MAKCSVCDRPFPRELTKIPNGGKLQEHDGFICDITDELFEEIRDKLSRNYIPTPGLLPHTKKINICERCYANWNFRPKEERK